MNKKIMLSIGAMSTIFTITPVLTCISLQQHEYNDNESWSDKVANIPKLKKYTWNANKATSIDELVDTMNRQMGIYLPKKMSVISPIEFANFALNFFNNNGGGNIIITTKYKNKSQDIFLHLLSPLINMIKSFDGPPAINNDTSRYNGNTLTGLLLIMKKISTSSTPIEAIKEFLKLFGDYGKTIFGTSSILTLFKDAISEKNLMLNNFVKLLEPFPAGTLAFLPKFFDLFKIMSMKINASPVDIQWAKDHNITDKLKNIDKIILLKLLNSPQY